MRKLRHRKSTEANLIRLLVSEGYANCNCEISTLSDRIAIVCQCDDTKETPSSSVLEGKEVIGKSGKKK